MTEPSTREFEYLLNAMEGASRAARPADLQYGAKRRCVLDYVEALRAQLSQRDERIATLEAAIRKTVVLGGITFKSDLSCPPGEARMYQDGRLVGVVTNLTNPAAVSRPPSGERT